MVAITRFPFQKLRRPFFSKYITLNFFLLWRRKGFATLLSVVVITDIKLIFLSFKTVICLVWKTPTRVDVERVKFTSFYVRAVMPAMSAKPLGNYSRACVSTWLVQFKTFINFSTMSHFMFWWVFQHLRSRFHNSPI